VNWQPLVDLEAALLQASARALAAGALQPIATRCELLTDEGVDFLLRVSALQQRKAAQRDARAASNPFLPYDPALFVGDLSQTHLVLLNKFKVMDGHALIVTRDFVDQESALDQSDFAALAATLIDMPRLVFYNAGVVAGASQRHRHLQLLPWPLQPGLAPVHPGAWGPPGLRHAPFAHAWAPLAAGDLLEPQRLLAHYQALLALQGLGGSAGYSGYNLLVTRAWMMLVRRRAVGVDGLDLNALGFAGTILLRSDEALQQLRALGPMNLLRAVSQ